MRLLIYSGKTARIDGDFARYARLETRDGMRVHVLYFQNTDAYRDYQEIDGIADSTYEAYTVEPLGDYYGETDNVDKKRNYFSNARYTRRY